MPPKSVALMKHVKKATTRRRAAREVRGNLIGVERAPVSTTGAVAGTPRPGGEDSMSGGTLMIWHRFSAERGAGTCPAPITAKRPTRRA